jgi:hypothetical protein
LVSILGNLAGQDFSTKTSIASFSAKASGVI